MKNRSLVLLATDFDPHKVNANGAMMSEKHDGGRALWLPFTRGLRFQSIPWANTARDSNDPLCSGLWTRRGKNIAAPSWFLDKLPQDTPLDGELSVGRGQFDRNMSIIRKLNPDDSEWRTINYHMFDIPSYEKFFTMGQIREGGKAGEPAYEVFFKTSWADLFNLRGNPWWQPRSFATNYDYLMAQSWGTPVHQERLSPMTRLAEARADEKMRELTAQGAEGVMLRQPWSVWEPYRLATLTKLKPLKDSEAVVIGFVMGKGHLTGKVGSFRLKWGNVEFDLSGFEEPEREIIPEGVAWAAEHPGEYTTTDLSAKFPIGTVVTFQYDNTTKDGIPRFARYWRRFQTA